MKGHVFPCRYCALRCTTRIQPARIIHRFLKISPIKLTITQENDFCPFWNQRSHQFHQFDVKRFGSMTLGALPHHPGSNSRTVLKCLNLNELHFELS